MIYKKSFGRFHLKIKYFIYEQHSIYLLLNNVRAYIIYNSIIFPFLSFSFYCFRPLFFLLLYFSIYHRRIRRLKSLLFIHIYAHILYIYLSYNYLYRFSSVCQFMLYQSLTVSLSTSLSLSLCNSFALCISLQSSTIPFFFIFL